VKLRAFLNCAKNDFKLNIINSVVLSQILYLSISRLILKPDQQQPILESVNYWLDKAVIGLGLCPFARPVRQQQSVRFAISDASRTETLLMDLYDECRYLEEYRSIETTLLICPHCLGDFDDFNQFLDKADAVLEYYKWQGVFQIASFHPRYQFAETLETDRENWTNRSPFPILHILRESSLDRAIEEYPAVDNIPDRNIQRLRGLDEEDFRRIFGSELVNRK